MADAELKRQKEAQIRAAINQKLIESGERERLKDLLRTKLVECGWRDELKAYCKGVITSKGEENYDNIKLEDLVAEIIPKGRSSVPANVKAELLARIRKFLSANPTL